jgi:hypothetical protein
MAWALDGLGNGMCVRWRGKQGNRNYQRRSREFCGVDFLSLLADVIVHFGGNRNRNRNKLLRFVSDASDFTIATASALQH